ncbi:MAG: hypothetical protein KZQ66_17120 [Candidatus Thiodiazotropha sp. (ex Lucinoma aequizonata)]|nr:hypothetical protein [Candidatus Thiodiazotropha sp. (ex Lucinoma aequizonata)]MCU7889400.1 hypothetical protein [Candidatus Thiodiazotropha sp. (ex Lucinoma aequizonata)]MCU7894216.1 hypothetical protein [Candidatus Thiodiazotropha sp. (ex Lucinoma aequizonata)]MCU7899716.1 hypothetical protein [Candidatus Thiodiazotropha sp. (ex Lucinoma aequizonata)]MCU7903495.1 hypothetical protein [Candidatus Thiodiazotropha sp. (ex Lucinoma aequizonata)]
MKELSEAQVGKKDWVLFLTTDIRLSMSKMLETYALRWGIEIYFAVSSNKCNSITQRLSPLAAP